MALHTTTQGQVVMLLTFDSAKEVNQVASEYRAAGHTVKVNKLNTIWEMAVSDEIDGCKATSRKAIESGNGKGEDNNVFFYNVSDWKQGAIDAAYLRQQGVACYYRKAKSGKCWVLRIVG